MITTHQKGINFKQTPVKKLLLIQPDTFSAYLSTLPASSGKIVFEFVSYTKLTKTSLFAGLSPLQEEVELPNPRAINFVKAGKRRLVVVHLESFNYLFATREGWIPFSFRFLMNSQTDFAEIIPEKQQPYSKAS